MKFKVGDTVQLNSGGPLMTVQEEYSPKEKKLTCQWFILNATTPYELKAGVFAEDSLHAAKPKPS
jgi:uncharacterized protein YodC (DUF2158 family)